MPLRLACLTVAALAAPLAGCDHVPSAPTDQPPGLPVAEQTPVVGQSARRLAWLPLKTDSSAIVVPATARVGQPVAVTVTTYGGGCVSEDTTVATVAGTTAAVFPYQKVYTPRENEACTDELRINRRTLALTFPAAGPAEVVVTGRTSSGKTSGDTVVRVVRTLTVQ